MLRLLKGRPMSMSLNEAKILRLLRDRPMSMSRSQAKILRFLKGRTMSMSRSRAKILRLLKGRPKSMSCEYWSKDLGSRFLLVLIRVQTALTLLEILSPHKAYKANSWAALMKSVCLPLALSVFQQQQQLDTAGVSVVKASGTLTFYSLLLDIMEGQTVNKKHQRLLKSLMLFCFDFDQQRSKVNCGIPGEREWEEQREVGGERGITKLRQKTGRSTRTYNWKKKCWEVKSIKEEAEEESDITLQLHTELCTQIRLIIKSS